MRHAVRGRKLGRQDAHRKALFRNQLASLFLHERIRTTLTKAKELRPLAEKLVTLARRRGSDADQLHARRVALSRIVQQDAVRRLFETIAPRFAERPGGYTRILKLGKLRKGDAAELALLEFVDYQFVSKEKKGDDKGKKGDSDAKAEKSSKAEKSKKGDKPSSKEKSESPAKPAKKDKDEKPSKGAKPGTEGAKPAKAKKADAKPKAKKGE